MRQGDQLDLSLLFQKSLMESKGKWSAAQFHQISIDLNLAYNKNKKYKTLDY